MRIAKYSKIILAILMMAFIGQAVASTAMSCLNESPQSDIQEQVMDFSIMDHSQHSNMNVGDSIDSSDCCPECDCSLGGCITAVAPTSEQSLKPSYSHAITGYSGLAEKQLATSLYRPPISH